MELVKPQKVVLQNRPYAEFLLTGILIDVGEDGLRAKDLAEKTSLSAPSLSRLLNKLEDDQTIERFHQRGNRKEVYVRLTEKRVDDLQSAQNLVFSMLENVAGIMGNEDVLTLAELLLKLHSALQSVLSECPDLKNPFMGIGSKTDE
jgi:DNA-binding MarR family transcriptional regulator